MKKPLIILAGPTGVGKTKLSISLAKRLNGEIISADSMQVYRKMNIGTAKIRPDEMQGISHHLIDILEPEEEFNVVLFAEYAKNACEQCYERGKIPILVGGTGFYIQALLYDIDFTENDDDKTYRESLELLAEEMGNEYLHEMLKNVDPKAACNIHPNNRKRVIRALEFYEKSGRKISEHNEEQQKKQSPYNYAYFVLTDERSLLYERIDARVELMLEEGLIQEVGALLNSGISRKTVSMQGLGYKEIAAYLCGECSYEEAVYILKRDTRHFAKRQLTWFKREDASIFLNRSEFEQNEDAILEKMIEIVKEKEITGTGENV
ncbi:MAG: tRNA (adenosine(37)-N6)-dimethylallyltransferase MiaA [Lachnospiraceae bacterium]|nr:tRNA (adenosine(37)-N6)-dimethylallyltransferase MiaA [Lachnospiraceae bacterium]